MLYIIFILTAIVFSAAVRIFFRKGKRTGFWAAGVAVVAGLCTLAVHIWGSVYLHSLWFNSLGYGARYWKVLTLKAELFAGGGLAAVIFFGVNFWFLRGWDAVKRGFSLLATKDHVPIVHLPHGSKDSGDYYPHDQFSWLRKGSIAVFCLIAAGIFVSGGSIFSSYWQQAILFFNRVPFGRLDPLFHRDLGFYIFALPWIKSILGFLWVLPI